MSMINIGISDLNIARAPDVLATYALGSCVGICLYDPDIKLAGLAHIMLPWSKEAASDRFNTRTYADTGITELLNEMLRNRAKRENITAKIAGGAQMFAGTNASFNIGERNVTAVKKILAAYKVPVIAEQTGENFGRTVFFHAENGQMEVRSATRETVIL